MWENENREKGVAKRKYSRYDIHCMCMYMYIYSELT